MDYSSDIKTIETNVVIAEEEGTFFKEVDFDFDSMPSEVYMKIQVQEYLWLII